MLLTGLAKPLSSEWQKCFQNLERDCIQVQRLAQVTEANIRKQRDLKLTDEKQGERRRRIAEWIKAGEDDAKLDVRMDIQKYLELHQPGTCTWLYEDSAFKHWRDVTTNTATWYVAGPGSGKTILCAALTKHLQASGLRTISFFFSFSDPSKGRVMTALRSLALQLLALSDTIPDVVLKMYESDVLTLQTEDTAIVVLQAFLKQTSRVHIILDGLDECSDRSLMKTVFFRLMTSDTYGLVKWFYSSRDEPDLRSLTQQIGASRIAASREHVMVDIEKYISEHTTLSDDQFGCIHYWTAASEGNFLWISLMLRILIGTDLTCNEDIQQELEKFPKGLVGCYVRSLQQLSSRPESHQELARGAEDHSSMRVPWSSLVEDLCAPLVIFDRGSKGCQKDPVLKLSHKSVQDFFTEIPTLGIPDTLHKYSVNLKTADLEFGHICLTYLSYARYQKAQDVLVLLDEGSEEHAFLKYAATFWFQHLIRADHSDLLFTEVERFVRSPAFWTCVIVQSKVAPHLFAVLTEGKTGCYRMSPVGPSRPNAHTGVSFSLPLPDWLDEYGPPGAAIIQDFLTYIKEWHPVLTRYPEAVGQCSTDAVCSNTFYGCNPLQSERVRIHQLCSPGIPKGRIVDTRLESCKGECSAVVLIDLPADSTSDSGIQLLRVTLHGNAGCELQSQEQNLRPVKVCGGIPKSARSNRTLYMDFGEDLESTLWILDPNDLSFTQYHGSKRNTFKAQADLEGPTDIPWSVDAKSDEYLSIRGRALAYHCSKPSDKPDEVDSGYASSPNLDSESDSESEPGSKSESFHCLAIAHKNSPPIWFTWQNEIHAQLQISCAFHPVESLAVWSHAPHELCIADLHTGDISSGVIPEPVGVQFRYALAVYKELRFSSCGKLLYYLLCSFTDDSPGKTCSITLSTWHFTTRKGEVSPLQRSCPAQHITYRFFAPNNALSPPFILTHWDPEHLYIALPTLSCSPKTVRIALQRETNTADFSSGSFQTLKSPIYFPSSTPCRNPQITVQKLLPRPNQANVEPSEYLFLSLNAQQTQNQEVHGALPALPPIVMTWFISGSDGWRDWDCEQDGQSEELTR
ncbi:hypothetical protein GP486_002340, partial [Trichoglossum hirsutum]